MTTLSNPYKFKMWDKVADDQPSRLSTSYCDDNDGMHGAKNIKELYTEVAKAVRMTGYFSVASELGRVGSKSLILLYNLDPRQVGEVRKWRFESYAWSFAHDSIIKETMPFRAQFRKGAEEMKNLSDLCQTAWCCEVSWCQNAL